MVINKSELDTSVNLSKNFSIQNPIITASGTFGYCDEFDCVFDVKKLGAIVTKAITLEPRAGNDHQRIIETSSGVINSIGLENVGINEFLKSKLPLIEKKGITYIVNIAGRSIDEYITLASMAEENHIKAIELNISCPNVKEGCLELGTSTESVFNLVNGVKKVYSGFVTVKLTPNVTNIEDIALAAQDGGADCLSAINTVKGLGLKLDYYGENFVLTHKVQGGLSGKAIKPIALSMVNRVKKVSKIPIIGMGGIYSFDDVLEFFAVGADAVQVGTANFTQPDICETLIYNLQNFMIKGNFKTLDELKEKLRHDVGSFL